MKTQKCCTHCPGKLVPPRRNEFHECCQPKYVSGNLKVSSLTKYVPPEYPERRKIEKDLAKPLSEDRPSCYDHFALAKRLHAENLEHQPLPDKVDDAVFKNIGQEKCWRRASPRTCSNCCQRESEDRAKNFRRYGPILGCKVPETKMDLAICWETPIDPVYEPPRPTHVDGSEGGLAPSIFALVQHSPNSKTSLRSESTKNKESCRDRCEAQENPSQSENERKEEDRKIVSSKHCCDYLCKNLDKVSISNKVGEERSKRSATFRKCLACEPRNVKGDPRLIKSAVGLALGIEKQENQRSNAKTSVPRPRTPFARRSFCIDTLTPPFSVVNKSRGADYPEHWRLMTVYQQSYKNPHRRRSSYH